MTTKFFRIDGFPGYSFLPESMLSHISAGVVRRETKREAHARAAEQMGLPETMPVVERIKLSGYAQLANRRATITFPTIQEGYEVEYDGRTNVYAIGAILPYVLGDGPIPESVGGLSTSLIWKVTPIPTDKVFDLIHRRIRRISPESREAVLTEAQSIAFRNRVSEYLQQRLYPEGLPNTGDAMEVFNDFVDFCCEDIKHYSNPENFHPQDLNNAVVRWMDSIEFSY